MLKKIKIETILLLSMIAWILRLGLFAYGDFTSSRHHRPLLINGCVWLCIYFFNIAGALFRKRNRP
ncbi:hypothetical protein AB6F55_10040 [Providencia hangzhouensis]